MEDCTHQDNGCYFLRMLPQLEWNKDGKGRWCLTALSSFWPRRQAQWKSIGPLGYPVDVDRDSSLVAH